MSEAEAIVDYCNEKFAGWTIRQFGLNEDGDVAMILSTINKKSKIAFLLSDPEGNDVGFIEEGEGIECH